MADGSYYIKVLTNDYTDGSGNFYPSQTVNLPLAIGPVRVQHNDTNGSYRLMTVATHENHRVEMALSLQNIDEYHMRHVTFTSNEHWIPVDFRLFRHVPKRWRMPLIGSFLMWLFPPSKNAIWLKLQCRNVNYPYFLQIFGWGQRINADEADIHQASWFLFEKRFFQFIMSK